MVEPLIEALDVRCVFRRPPNLVDQIQGMLGRLVAQDVVPVDGVSLTVEAGARLGIIGASGGGKSTLGRLLGGVLMPDEGTIRWQGTDVATLSNRARHQWRRRHIQMLAQNQYGALNPRMRVREAVEESLRVHRPELLGDARRAEAITLLKRAAIDDCAERFVPALSGGERRRVTLACLIAANPEVIILDEPVAGLDPILRNDAVRLLESLLKAQPKIALVLISHELDVVERLCQDVVVMQAGKIVEKMKIGDEPQHPHTRELVAQHQASALPTQLRAKYLKSEGSEDGVAIMEYIMVLGTATIFFGAVIFALGGSMHGYLDMALWWLSNPVF